MSRNAKTSSSSSTTCAGRSPATISQKRHDKHPVCSYLRSPATQAVCGRSSAGAPSLASRDDSDQSLRSPATQAASRASTIHHRGLRGRFHVPAVTARCTTTAGEDSAVECSLIPWGGRDRSVRHARRCPAHVRPRHVGGTRRPAFAGALRRTRRRPADRRDQRARSQARSSRARLGGAPGVAHARTISPGRSADRSAARQRRRRHAARRAQPSGHVHAPCCADDGQQRPSHPRCRQEPGRRRTRRHGRDEGLAIAPQGQHRRP